MTTARAPGSAPTARGCITPRATTPLPVPGGEAIFLDAVLGVAKTSVGTRVVAGNANGEARLYALTMAGVEGFHSGPGVVVAALVRSRRRGRVDRRPAGKAAGVHAAGPRAQRGLAPRRAALLVAGARARRTLGRGADGRQAAARRDAGGVGRAGPVRRQQAHGRRPRRAGPAAVPPRVAAGRRRPAAVCGVRVARALHRRDRRTARLADRRRQLSPDPAGRAGSGDTGGADDRRAGERCSRSRASPTRAAW